MGLKLGGNPINKGDCGKMNIIVNQVLTKNGKMLRIKSTFSLAEVSAMKPHGDKAHKEGKKKIIRVRRSS